MLKAKEDRSQPQSSQSPSPVVSPKPTSNKVSFKDRLTLVTSDKKEPIKDLVRKDSVKRDSISFKDGEKSSLGVIKEGLIEPETIPPPLVISPPPKSVSPILEFEEKSSSASDENCPWSKLKQAAIVSARDSISSQDEEVQSKKNKPNLLLLQNRTKQYESIDDLSPEYCGLPFVKKLKILNERQKLAELEYVMKARSVSLDIPGDKEFEDTITRSRSEASGMHSCNTLDVALTENPPTSPESNETLGKVSQNMEHILVVKQAPDVSTNSKMCFLYRKKKLKIHTKEIIRRSSNFTNRTPQY